MTPAIASLLAQLPTAGTPRQDSTNAQLADVDRFLQARGCAPASDADKMLVANRLGMYDAADIYKLRAQKAQAKTTT